MGFKVKEWIRFSGSGPGSLASQGWNCRRLSLSYESLLRFSLCAAGVMQKTLRKGSFLPLNGPMFPLDTAPINFESKNTSVSQVSSEGNKQKQKQKQKLAVCAGVFGTFSFQLFIFHTSYTNHHCLLKTLIPEEEALCILPQEWEVCEMSTITVTVHLLARIPYYLSLSWKPPRGSHSVLSTHNKLTIGTYVGYRTVLWEVVSKCPKSNS